MALRGASQLCKNKGCRIIREAGSRIMRGIQSCGLSFSCSAPEVIFSKQSSRERMILCISSITERLKTDITASIWSVVPAFPRCLYLLNSDDVAHGKYGADTCNL